MGEETPDPVEIQCPGCGRRFRLKPKKGRLPTADIPCPRCSNPIPVKDGEVVVDGAGADEESEADDESAPGFGVLSGPRDDNGSDGNEFQRDTAKTRVASVDEMTSDAEQATTDEQDAIAELEKMADELPSSDTSGTIMGIPGVGAEESSENEFDKSRHDKTRTVDTDKLHQLTDSDAETGAGESSRVEFDSADAPDTSPRLVDPEQAAELAEESSTTATGTQALPEEEPPTGLRDGGAPSEPTAGDSDPLSRETAENESIPRELAEPSSEADSTREIDTNKLKEKSFLDRVREKTKRQRGNSQSERTSHDKRNSSSAPVGRITPKSKRVSRSEPKSAERGNDTSTDDGGDQSSLSNLFEKVRKRRGVNSGDVRSKLKAEDIDTIGDLEDALDDDTDLGERVNLSEDELKDIVEQSADSPDDTVESDVTVSDGESAPEGSDAPESPDHSGLFDNVESPEDTGSGASAEIGDVSDDPGSTTTSSMLARLKKGRNRGDASPGAAGEKRGSGYIRLPTEDIQDVLGHGDFRIKIEGVVYEPVDKEGLIKLIKGGVLLGAEEIARGEDDWMPVSEHPVFGELRRKMAAEAHEVLSRIGTRPRPEQSEPDQPEPDQPDPDQRAPDDSIELPASKTGDAAPTKHSLPTPKRTSAPEPSSPSESDESSIADETSAPLPAPVDSEQAPPPETSPPKSSKPAFGDDEPPVEEPQPDEPSPRNAEATQPDDATAESPSGPSIDVKADDEPSEPEPADPPPPQKPRAQTDGRFDIPDDDGEDDVAATDAFDDDPPVASLAGGSGSRIGKRIALIAAVLFVAAASGFLLLTAPGHEIVADTTGWSPQKSGMIALFDDTEDVEPKSDEPDPAVDAAMDEAASLLLLAASDPPESTDVEQWVDDRLDDADYAEAVELMNVQFDDGRRGRDFLVDLTDARHHTGDFSGARQAAMVGMVEFPDEEQFRDAHTAAIEEDRQLFTYDEVDLTDPGNYTARETYDVADHRGVVLETDGDDAPVLFKPQRDGWEFGWRAEVATWRFCELVVCHFDVYEVQPAVATRAFFEGLHGAGEDLDELLAEASWETVELHGESVEAVRGSLERLPDTSPAPFPIEYRPLWRNWLTAGSPTDFVDQPATAQLDQIEQVADGQFATALQSPLDEMSTGDVARAVSSLLVFDYLTNNWERWSTNPATYGQNNPIVDSRMIARHNAPTFQPRASNRVRGRFEWTSRFSRSTVASIRALDRETTLEVLFPEATAGERRRFNVMWSQRNDLLERIDTLVARHDERDVLLFP